MSNFDSSRANRRLATISNMANMPEYRDAFSTSSIRHLIFQAKQRVDSKGRAIPTNGLEEAGAIVRIGSKVLLDLNRFDSWVESKKNTPATATEAESHLADYEKSYVRTNTAENGGSQK